MLKPISEVVKEIVDKINNVIVIDGYLDNLDGTYTLTVCDSLYLIPMKTVTIDGNNYKVLSVQNNVIVLQGTEPIVVDSFEIQKPYFENGTPIMANIELVQMEVAEKFPLVYLYENTRERYFNDAVVTLESDVVLFIMDEIDPLQWTTDQHDDNVINPMRNIVEQINEIMVKYRGLFSKPSFFDVTKQPNFGNATRQGNTQSYFTDDMSGVELRLKIEYRGKTCKKGC